ncbi:MAG TPA: RNA-binding protein [Candidatus Melainabacteria bacterium]|nr:RNA-binding protein [Candidatus Melainabacteria bacterium]
MQNKLFVGNISFNCGNSQLRELFTEFGDVTSATVVMDRATGKARGFGFVEMSTQTEAEAAMRGLEGREFGGRTLHVSMAESREKRAEGFGRNRR